PVISVNGNAAALVPLELAALSQALGASLEVNLFHASRERADKIRAHLLAHGAHQVLLPDENFVIAGLESNRRFVNGEGIYRADAVFVPLEDGDRCEALVRSGRKVITIDLNPLSRTARNATITIVDNIVRALPLLLDCVNALAMGSAEAIRDYDNGAALREAEAVIRGGDA
ncbi:MAG: DUF137 domain-containing protein, partial [Blastocatellia bacterium]|nr:DUF137 domain-containing protein [Blastocatellia bacterium]